MATRIGVGVSDDPDAKTAFSQAAAAAAEQLDGARCDLAVIFALGAAARGRATRSSRRSPRSSTRGR